MFIILFMLYKVLTINYKNLVHRTYYVSFQILCLMIGDQDETLCRLV